MFHHELCVSLHALRTKAITLRKVNVGGQMIGFQDGLQNRCVDRRE